MQISNAQAMNATRNFIGGTLLILGCWGISTCCSNNKPPTSEKEQGASAYNDLPADYYCYPKRDALRKSDNQTSNNKPARGKYHYTVTISQPEQEWETYEQRELINGEIQLKRRQANKIPEYLIGTYIWDMDEYLPSEQAMYNYIANNYERMKYYKVSYRGDGSDEFNDRLDEYYADPEDESEFDPDIFDFYLD